MGRETGKLSELNSSAACAERKIARFIEMILLMVAEANTSLWVNDVERSGVALDE
jgi:hypothetical protein